jgi:hypothetical protein
MRTRERVLLATLAVAGLTILTGATASATTIEVTTSTQSAGTFAVVPNGNTIRLAVHTTALTDQTSSDTATATSPEVVDAPDSTPSVTPAGPTKASHKATAETILVGAKPQVSVVFGILANSLTGRRTAGRADATTSGLEVSAAVADPANRGGASPSSSANRRTATSGAVVRC